VARSNSRLSVQSGSSLENVVGAFELWLRATELANLGRKEFFGLLVEGSTLADALKAKYDTWTHRGSFMNKSPERSGNDVIYWGKRILLWMAQFITMVGEVPNTGEIMGKTIRLKVDRLLDTLRTAPEQYEQWKAKIVARDVTCGKNWMHRTYEMLESAYRSVSMYEGGLYMAMG
jgi:hypothetical protein